MKILRGVLPFFSFAVYQFLQFAFLQWYQDGSCYLEYNANLRVQKPQRGVILVIKADPSVFLAPEERNIGSK
jgi:hypothetical protein